MQLILLVFALVIFLVAAFVNPPRINLLAVGLAFLAASFLVPHMGD